MQLIKVEVGDKQLVQFGGVDLNGRKHHHSKHGCHGEKQSYSHCKAVREKGKQSGTMKSLYNEQANPFDSGLSRQE